LPAAAVVRRVAAKIERVFAYSFDRTVSARVIHISSVSRKIVVGLA
jgi:hypothetical protein